MPAGGSGPVPTKTPYRNIANMYAMFDAIEDPPPALTEALGTWATYCAGCGDVADKIEATFEE